MNAYKDLTLVFGKIFNKAELSIDEVSFGEASIGIVHIMKRLVLIVLKAVIQKNHLRLKELILEKFWPLREANM